MDRRLGAVALPALVAVLASCNAPLGPASSAVPTIAPGSATSAAPGASQTLLAIPSFGPEFHGDPDLEATLPGEFDGQPLVVLSLRGDTFFENAVPELDRFRAAVEDVGGEGDDVSLAVATAAVAALPFLLAALRVEGTEARRLTEAFERAALDADAGVTAAPANIGGKDIVKATAPGDLVGGSYFYGSGDTIFVVRARDDALAGRLLQALP